MKILLTGGTGFVGRRLVDALIQKNYEIILLSRNPHAIPTHPQIRSSGWNGKEINPSLIEGCYAVINLAGESIAGARWTTDQKKGILESRINAANAVVQAVKQASQKPAVLLNASAVGYYSGSGEEVTENSPPGTGFLADTCKEWEQAARAAERSGARVVFLRLGIVLEKGGGALSKMLLPFKLYAGGPLGSGEQWFPWIHRQDVIDVILFPLDNPISGRVNLTSPGGMKMKDFCKVLGRVMNRPSWVPLPAFVLRILLGEMADLLLKGQRAVPKKLLDYGYRFRYPEDRKSVV